MKRLVYFSAMLILLAPAATIAGGPGQDGTLSGKSGLSASFCAAPMVFGDSGPETPVSDTLYADTFDSGLGVRIEFSSRLPGDMSYIFGGICCEYPGKSFKGGEFPHGATFGDLTAAGFYFGGKYSFLSGPVFNPYILGDIGILFLSSLDVTVNGKTIPYFGDTLVDMLELGLGAEWSLNDAAFLFADIRFQLFGAPRGINYPISEATGGQALPVSVGMGVRF